MKKKISRTVGILVLLAMLLSGCNTKQEDKSIAGEQTSNPDQTIQTIQLEKGSYTIKKSGIYELVGTLDNGSIVVDVDKEVDQGLVTLVLNQVKISSLDSAPIFIKNAEEVHLVLTEGTTNQILQGENCVEDSEGEPNAAIYSKVDLVIEGSGTLEVVSQYNDGITSKDTLTLKSGIIRVESVGDCIVGKDLLNIYGGEFTLVSGGGFSEALVTSSNQSNGGMTFSPRQPVISTIDENKESAKGLKTEGSLSIESGTFIISALDDAIHANVDVNILGGNYIIDSNDDAIHADQTVNIINGQIQINQSYEGIEGTNIVIEAGVLKINSMDDGFNCNVSSGILTIKGGDIDMVALGDGLDSNGSIVMTGGNVWVSGPINDGNGALDYDRSFVISGGSLVATGSSGMAQAPGNTSTQASILMYFSTTQASGSELSLKDSSGKVLLIVTPENAYSSAALSHQEIKVGQNYSLFSNGNLVVTFTVNGPITYLNESGVTTGQTQATRGFPGGIKIPIR